MTSVRFNVLGPWGVHASGIEVKIPNGQLRVLLAVLLVSVGEPVPVETLVERLWPEDRRRSRDALYTYTSRLRALLGSDTIQSTAGGYRLCVAADGVDLYRFRDLLRRAGEAASAEGELALLRAALRLWRGRPFGDLPSTWLDREVVPWLTEEWFAATERRIDLELPTRPGTLLPVLWDLTSRYPTRESLWHRLMTALHGAGRRVEALDVFQQARRLLSDELGIEPSEQLVRLQRAILLDGCTTPHEPPGDRLVAARREARREEPRPRAIVEAVGFGELLRACRARLSWTQRELARRAELSARTVTGLESGRVRPRPGTARMLADALALDGPDREWFLAAAGGTEPPAPPGPVAPAAAAMPVAAQLPADIIDFTGRASELASMDTLVPVTAGTRVAVLAGAAGVGKTALAVRWAHRVAAGFPDGQLYENLRGFAPGPPVQPVEVLARFLATLGVPADRIPPTEAAAAALYRSMVAGRRMLVVLDNAVDADQVRPLLPGGTASLVLVTSRHLLTGLVVSHGAHQHTLTPLAQPDAVELVTRILGAARVAVEPDAAAALVEECARLPLALRIAAANVRADPHLAVGGYVAELRAGDRLTPLAVDGDPTASVRNAFGWSHDRLAEPVQRLFRYLSLVPGPDVTPGAAAALTGADPAEAGRWLRVLADASLLDQHAPQRYAFHDLLRAYATERTQAEDGDPERDAALRRLLDWYLHSAIAASSLLSTTLRLPTPPPMEHLPIVRHDDRATALAWLEAERDNLVAAVSHAAAHGPHESAWWLGDALRGYFDATGHVVDWMTVALAAGSAAAASGDLAARAAATAHLAHAYHYAGDFDTAIEQATEALTLSRQAGWTASEARVLNNLATMHSECGRLDQAADLLERALALDLRAGTSKATRLYNLGLVYALVGRLAEAVEHLERAVDGYRSDGKSAPWALAGLGDVRRLTGDFNAATRCLTQTLAIARKEGGRRAEAFGLALLSEVHRDRGQLAKARHHADAAETIAREVGDLLWETWAAACLASVDLLLGRPEPAAARYETVLRAVGDEIFAANRIIALIGLATARRQLGQLDDAATHADQGRKLAEAGGYRIYQGEAFTVLAAIHLERHRVDRDPIALDAALAAAKAALELQRRTGHRVGEARTLIVLGDIARRADSPVAAASRWRSALTVSEKLGLPEARELRTRLGVVGEDR